MRQVLMPLKHLLAKPLVRRIGSNMGWLVMERGIRIVVGLVVTVWIARYFGPAQYGNLGFAMAFTAILGIVCSLGLEGIAVRDIARAPDQAGVILGTALWLRIAASLVIVSLGSVVAMTLLRIDVDARLLTCIVLLSLVFQSAETFDYWYRSTLNSRLTVTSRLGALLICSAARVALILLSASLLAFGAMVVVESLVFAIAMLIAFRAHATSSRLSFSRVQAVSLLRDSLPFLLAGIATLVCLRVAQVLLPQLSSAEQNGLYGAVLPITEGFYVLSTSASVTLLPVFSRLLNENPARFQRMFERLLWGIIVLGVVIALTVSVGADLLVRLLLGERYAQAGGVLRIHSWSIVFVFLSVIENIWIVLHNHGPAKLYKNVVGAVANIGLGFLLIPSLGAQGAALAGVISFFCLSYLSNAIFVPPLFRMQSRLLLPWTWPALWRA
ncbi:MAG: flippase [Nevskiaceae bacterium]|jgi:PST family polysaccharide transporter|nr:flippase [Nevskiaceae bacterium]